MVDKRVFHTDERAAHQSSMDLHWWTAGIKADKRKLGQLTTDFQLLTNDNQRGEAYKTYASLYTNRHIARGGAILKEYSADWMIKKAKYSRCPYNLMKIVIDEAVSRVTKSHPKAKFMTHGANRKAKRKAEMMERWNDGEVQRLRQEELFDASLRDACQYGLGSLKHTKAYRESRIQTLRVYPGNLFVDLEETLFNEPTRLHHRRFVSKTQMHAMFPKFKGAIASSNQVSDAADYVSAYGEHAGAQDRLELIESWHLPSFVEGIGKNAKSPDGIRVLWIQKAILQISIYNRRVFPFSFFNWKTDPHNTFYGVGLGEDLLGVHVDANATINRVNNAIEKIALPHILTKKGQKVSKAQLGNESGSIWEYSGSDPPIVVMPNVVAGDLLRYVQEHKARAFEIAGLSSGTQGGLPQSLQTGAAVENFIAADAIPFNQQLRKFENFVKHVAENNIAVGRAIHEVDKKFSVVLPGEKNTIEEINWKDVALDPADESYVIRVTPVSGLSETPAARLAELERMVAMGMITDPVKLRELQNIPDFEGYDDYASAAERNVDRMIDLALDDNVFSPPMPNMDLQYFVIRAAEAEQKAHDYEKVPDENISTLRRMGRRAEELIQRQAAAALAQQAGQLTPTQPAQDPSTGVQPNAIQATPAGQ